MTMPFLIRHYRLTKKYGRKKLLKEFPQKNWSETELRKLLNKIDEMGDTHTKKKTRQQKTTNVSIRCKYWHCWKSDFELGEYPGTHLSLSEIEMETGMPQASVNWIRKFDLGNYQQFYHTFADFCSSQKQALNVPSLSKIALSYICWVLYQSGTYLITNDDSLTACLHIFLVLSWSGTNFNIFGFFVIAPILFFGDSLSSVLYSLPRILWLLIQKK